MPDLVAAGRNFGAKVLRRTLGLHRPFVRQVRRAARLRDQAAEVSAELQVLRDIGRVARGRTPIVVGPWLSEVGYEVLYWIPFLRWFKDRYRLDEDRLIVVSRGGTAAWYSDLTSRYVEILGLMEPSEFAARNDVRRRGDESGGQKQLARGALDDALVELVRREVDLDEVHVCHPSLMYRLFRQFWFGNRALDVVLSHARFAPMRAFEEARPAGLPARFTAVKFYTGAAIPDTPEHRVTLRAMVARLAQDRPVVLLDTGLALDEHADYPFAGLPNVISLQHHLRPESNLGVQTAVIAAASAYVGTCGSLAWLAPLLGVPTVAAYAEDRFLLSHLYVARHAYKQAGAAPFLPLDLIGAMHLGALQPGAVPVLE